MRKENIIGHKIAKEILEDYKIFSEDIHSLLDVVSLTRAKDIISDEISRLK